MFNNLIFCFFHERQKKNWTEHCNSPSYAKDLLSPAFYFLESSKLLSFQNNSRPHLLSCQSLGLVPLSEPYLNCLFIKKPSVGPKDLFIFLSFQWHIDFSGSSSLIEPERRRSMTPVFLILITIQSITLSSIWTYPECHVVIACLHFESDPSVSSCSVC